MFGDPIILKRGDLRTLNDRPWRAAVDEVAQRFQHAFPDVIFDVAWNVKALNGAAWREMRQRHVRLYGGLVRHRLIGIEAVALLFAHETGHHYGGEPKDEFYEWMSCERQADRWAAGRGMTLAWNGDHREAARQVRAGARQLLAFERSMIDTQNEWAGRHLGDAPDHADPDERYRIFIDALLMNERGSCAAS